MGLFSSTKCIDCKKTDNVKRCPFCKKAICETCLKHLVLKDGTPTPLVGKQVSDIKEFKQLYLSYKQMFTKKGFTIHFCDEFIHQAWKGIISQVKDFENETEQKASKITLK